MDLSLRSRVLGARCGHAPAGCSVEVPEKHLCVPGTGFTSDALAREPPHDPIQHPKLLVEVGGLADDLRLDIVLGLQSLVELFQVFREAGRNKAVTARERNVSCIVPEQAR